MSDKQQILFHIGLPKSASTTLQKHVFPIIPAINNFALYPTNNVAGNNKVPLNVNSIYLKDRQLFEFYKALHNKPDVGVDELSRMWSVLYAKYGKYPTSLLSHEAITSAFFSSISVPEKLLRIHTVFPRVKVCIVIRDQKSWLHSQYTDHPFEPTSLANGKPCSFDSWVESFLTHPKLEAAREALNYFELVTNCQELFGKENTSVIKLEWLKSQSHNFTEVLAGFLGVSSTFVAESLISKTENRGLSGVYNILRQKERTEKHNKTSKWMTKQLLKLNMIKRFPKAKYLLSEELSARLDSYYASSNQQLKQLLKW